MVYCRKFHKLKSVKFQLPQKSCSRARKGYSQKFVQSFSNAHHCTIKVWCSLILLQMLWQHYLYGVDLLNGASWMSFHCQNNGTLHHMTLRTYQHTRTSIIVPIFKGRNLYENYKYKYVISIFLKYYFMTFYSFKANVELRVRVLTQQGLQ